MYRLEQELRVVDSITAAVLEVFQDHE